MAAPEIAECKIVPRKVTLADGKLYAMTEILMTDGRGTNYCSRTWEQLADSPFMRAYQIEQFKKRWDANERRGAD